MTILVDSEAWRALPAEIADVIEPELDEVTEEILATIGHEVPEYARPLEGNFGRNLRTGVAEALRQFVALIRDPSAGRGPGRDVYVALGRGEFRQGRTLDSLQAAYRVGARVAWRRFAEAARRAGVEAEALSLLAEAIFAYIDELSADSVEGYAEARSEVEDERRRLRRELARLLTREPPADAADLTVAAQHAAWPLPRRVAALACRESDLGAIGHRLPVEALVTHLDELGCILLPDPDGPGRPAELARAAGDRALAVGPAGGAGELSGSWSLARSALAAVEAGALPAEGVLRADDHLADILLFQARGLAGRIAERRLAPLEPLTDRARRRMRETALAYLRHHGNSVAMAAELHIHPQTARYRMARLRELIGDQLDDPNARFELEIALRRPTA